MTRLLMLFENLTITEDSKVRKPHTFAHHRCHKISAYWCQGTYFCTFAVQSCQLQTQKYSLKVLMKKYSMMMHQSSFHDMACTKFSLIFYFYFFNLLLYQRDYSQILVQKHCWLCSVFQDSTVVSFLPRILFCFVFSSFLRMLHTNCTARYFRL